MVLPADSAGDVLFGDSECAGFPRWLITLPWCQIQYVRTRPKKKQEQHELPTSFHFQSG